MQSSFSTSFVFLLLTSVVSGQSICQLASPTNVCIDDAAYLHCRLQEEFDAIEPSNSSLSTEPLFSESGRTQCESFVDRGFCVSQPTEMAAYCCQSFGRHCSSRNETLPRPPDGNEVMFDDESVAGPVTTTTTSTTAPSNMETVPTTVTTSTVTTAFGLERDSKLISPGLCDFVDAVAEMGVVAIKALRENLSFLLDDPSSSNSENPRAISEEKVPDLVHEYIEMPPVEWSTEPAESSPKSALPAKGRRRRQGRSLQEVGEDRDVPTPDVPTPDVPTPDVPTPDVPTPDVPTPDVPTPDVPILDVSTYAPTSMPEGNVNLRSAEPVTDSSIDEPSEGEQDVLGLLGMLATGSGELLNVLVPDFDFAEVNYTRMEDNLITYGTLLAKKFKNCDGCLLPLIESALDGAFQIPAVDGLNSVQRRRIAKKNEKAFIKMTSTEFEPRLISSMAMFSDELNTEHRRWLSSKSKDLDMDGFMEHATSALRRVLKKDNLGGIVQNLLQVIGVVNNNLQDPLKATAIKTNAGKIYAETVECPMPSFDIIDTHETNHSSEARRLITIEGLLGEDYLLDSWRGEKMEKVVRQLQEESPAEEVGFDVDSPKDLNFISDLTTSPGDLTSEDNHDTSVLEGTEDGILEGQPCLDRPSEFVLSLQRSYGDLNCNDLISAIGCEPQRFILPFKLVVESCRLSWVLRCGPHSESGLTLEDIGDEVMEVLIKSNCVTTAEFTSTTTTTSTTIEMTSNTMTETPLVTIPSPPTTKKSFAFCVSSLVPVCTIFALLLV